MVGVKEEMILKKMRTMVDMVDMGDRWGASHNETLRI